MKKQKLVKNNKNGEIWLYAKYRKTSVRKKIIKICKKK